MAASSTTHPAIHQQHNNNTPLFQVICGAVQVQRACLQRHTGIATTRSKREKQMTSTFRSTLCNTSSSSICSSFCKTLSSTVTKAAHCHIVASLRSLPLVSDDCNQVIDETRPFCQLRGGGVHPGPQVQLMGKGHMVQSLGHPEGMSVQLHGYDIATQVPLGALSALRIPAVGQVQTCVWQSHPRRHNEGYTTFYNRNGL